MKKAAILIMLLLSAALPAAASVRWTPSISIEEGYKADWLQEYVSSSYYAELEADPIAISIGRHAISLPFSAAYSTVGSEHLWVRKQAEAVFTLEARYSYRFTDLFSLGIGCGIRGQWHLGTRYLSMSAGGSIVPGFRIQDWLWITVPVSVYGSRNDWSITAGAGISIRFMEGL